jgi:virginiamycin B lyase
MSLARSAFRCAAFGVLLAGAPTVRSATLRSPAVTGLVSSSEEGPMAGVVVSFKMGGSTITTSVVTDDNGTYAFPADRLPPGHYFVSARAVGYDLRGPMSADVDVKRPGVVDLQLEKTKGLPDQLTSAEWLTSIPGQATQKNFLLGCVECHTAERIVESTHDSEQFQQVFQRMAGYYPGSEPALPQRLVGNARRDVTHGGNAEATAAWLASINLSTQNKWPYPLETLPRLKGASSHVVITEYALPSPLIQPHDVVLDHEGKVWFSDFGEMQLGELDPTSGKVTTYPIPVTKPGFPKGALDLEIDADDNPWVGMMYQASLVRFDRKTSTFRVWRIPPQWDTDAAQFGHFAIYGTPADEKVWIKNSDGSKIYRLDLATNAFEDFGSFTNPLTGKKLGAYGVYSDSHNNLYLLDFSAQGIGKIDARTKAFSYYQTPTPNSRPRRGRVDSNDRLWFAEFGSNAIGMFDPETKKIREWRIPTPWTAPYDVALDKNGQAWSGSMLTDRVQRLDVKSDAITEYPLPHTTNIRRVYVDDTKSPGTLWIGNDHAATIIKVEPTE